MRKEVWMRKGEEGNNEKERGRGKERTVREEKGWGSNKGTKEMHC